MTIYFGLLGAFFCGNTQEERAKNSALLGKMGKKTLSFLQYLIMNHARSVSSEELIEQFWSENSSNPAGALRNMLFKVRTLLKSMFPEEDGLLLTCQDSYGWNPEIRLELDAERLESLCLQAKRAQGEKRCKLLCEVAALYKGDFLSGNDGEWARIQRQYYQTLYLDACRKVLPLLGKKEQWMEIIGICSQAYVVDFSMEDFTAYQMQALIALGQPEQAVEKYEIFRDSLLEEYGLPPTERVEQLYMLATGLRKKEINYKNIFDLVCGEEQEAHAFFCTFSTFQSIVALERRHLERSGQKSTLVIISLGSRAVPTTDGRRLEHILLEKLRAGDSVARLEAETYILMLTGAGLEDAQLVAGRIDCAFHRAYRHSGANLTFRMEGLKPMSREQCT